MRWWADNKDASATIKQEQAYGYKYDALNRILAADFRENTGSWQNPSTTFDVSGISYDFNGNIKSLNRFGQGSQIDQLTYGYENSGRSNRLAYVNDAQSNLEGFTEHTETTSEYAYDWNGNMTRDDNKRMTSITYNTLNLPETIVKATDTETRTISYACDATGIKHENRLPNGDKLQYLGKFVYRNGSLEYILNEEGKLNVAGSSGSYQFFVKDHLGNTRLSINADTKEVAEINHYYPFGMRMAGGTEDPNQKYLYNGKELQDETDWLDYGARFYDAQLGRWHTIDPLAEMYESYSSYAYTMNNPIRYIDVNGMYSTEEWMKDNGITNDDLTTIYSSNDNTSDDSDEDSNKKDYIPDFPSFNELFRSTMDGVLGIFFRTDENTPKEAIDENAFAGARIDFVPEAAGLVVSGDFFFGMGGGGDYGFLYVEGQGWCMIFNGRGGLGADVALSSSVLLGYTIERNPQIQTIGGAGFYTNVGLGVLNLGMSSGYDVQRKERAPWSFINVGLGVGSKTISVAGGSSGVSGTKVIPLKNE